MKSLIIGLFGLFLAGNAALSQKATAHSDTTLKPYLTYSCSMHPQYVSSSPGNCPVCNMVMSLSPKERMKADVVKLYTCPVHPDVLCTKAGKCPGCKTDLVEFKPKNQSKQP